MGSVSHKPWCTYCGGEHVVRDCPEMVDMPEPGSSEALDHGLPAGDPRVCEVCLGLIEIMINQGSGVCSENCRKKLVPPDRRPTATGSGWCAPSDALGVAYDYLTDGLFKLGWWAW
jgi:hypothetical protein